MKILDSFGDHLIDDTTVAGCALADRSELELGLFRLESFANGPALNAFADPTLFSVCGRHEDASFAAGMVQQESPLGFQFGDVSVGDLDGLEGIHYNEAHIVENQLWSYPQNVGKGCKGCSQAKVDRKHASLTRVSNGLYQEHGVQGESENGPSQIALGAKDLTLLHSTIIASKSFDGTGN